MSKPTTGFTVGSHFEGKGPNVREVYDEILNAVRQVGPLTEEPKKTSIHLVNVTAFAGVATRKDFLILTVKSARRLTSPRVHRAEQTSANRFHSEIRLNSSADVDAELIGWLKDAYALSA